MIGFVIGMQILLLFVLVYVLHKVRRVHQATFRLNDRMGAETNGLFGQVEALVALYYGLRFRHPLPSMRRFAASPDLLNILTEHCLRTKPNVIVECSSGVSSLVLSKCCERNGRGRVYSLENGSEYAGRTRISIEREGVAEFSNVIEAPLKPYKLGGEEFRWYSLEGLPDVKIDVLVVDGPPGFLGSLARYPAIPLLHDRLAPEVSIFIDDADREDESAMVKRWLAEYPEFRAEKLAAEKGCVRLFRAPK